MVKIEDGLQTIKDSSPIGNKFFLLTQPVNDDVRRVFVSHTSLLPYDHTENKENS